ncbi:sigma-70 family RNA polymerase sigma factor [Massilia sp. 9I]|uniref:sigma-70 family RNA polymerase sigma factor n=1 Tax=Massilia sp. 9I TaxID=2653152 RepID=UPI0012EFD38A|nr:sigma-70 family RNA polymerase sigma factor [Massilia sp. 9I]VXB88420.1 RNA polymerase sigma-H factor [Massilia sp. 9I]
MKSRRELDLELVTAAQAGDIQAFNTLVRRYKTRLTRYLSSFLRDYGDTEDVAQETLIKAYLGLHSFRGDSSFATWLFRIGINTAKRTLVHNRRRFPPMSELTDDTAGSLQHSGSETDFDSPEATMETKQVLAKLNTALDELPTEQRTALILRELEGYTYDEIAEQMHTPVGTVRSRIHRARDTIAALLRKD